MKLKFALVFILVALVAGLWIYEQFVPPFSKGMEVADFSLIDMHGNTVRLSSLRGQSVLIHFWASWCSQCAHEMPLFAKFDKLYPSIKLLAVSEDEGGEAAVKAYFTGVKPNFTVLLDPEGRVSDRFKSYRVPESFLLDKNGKFLHRFIGAVSWDEPQVMEIVKKMISE